MRGRSGLGRLPPDRLRTAPLVAHSQSAHSIPLHRADAKHHSFLVDESLRDPGDGDAICVVVGCGEKWCAVPQPPGVSGSTCCGGPAAPPAGAGAGPAAARGEPALRGLHARDAGALPRDAELPRLGFTRLLLASASPLLRAASQPCVRSMPATFHASRRLRFSSAVCSFRGPGKAWGGSVGASPQQPRTLAPAGDKALDRSLLKGEWCGERSL
jgi:hypothetical protein